MRVMLWISLGLFGAYLMFYLVFGRMGLLAQVRLQDESARTRSEIAQVQADIQQLTAAAEALRSDPHRVEQLARERLGLVRPGETVFLFEAPADNDASGR